MNFSGDENLVHLQVITINESEKWDNIVRSFRGYDVCYLSGFSKAFQLNGEGEPLLLHYEDDSTKAMNVVMKRDISKSENFWDKIPANTWFDLSTPYGYGGFWIEGNRYGAINEAYSSYCQEQGFVSEFVRFHLFGGYPSYYSGTSETQSHNVVRSLELSIDDILGEFEHKVRKNLKRAAAFGLEICIDSTGARLDEFLEIYYDTMDRTGAEGNFFFEKRFFETLNSMTNNYTYLHVLYEGKVISSELVLNGVENCYSFLGGTNRDFFHLRPNDFLKYEIIKWAKEKGLKRFILGGGYGDDDGIFRYKKSFAPNGIYDFFIGKRIFDQKKYETLVQLRCDAAVINGNIGYFPEYRR